MAVIRRAYQTETDWDRADNLCYHRVNKQLTSCICSFLLCQNGEKDKHGDRRVVKQNVGFELQRSRVLFPVIPMTLSTTFTPTNRLLSTLEIV